MVDPTPRPLIVVCAGGHAAELASYVRDAQVMGESMYVRCFTDDHRFEPSFEGAPLLGGIDQLGVFLAAHPDEMFSFITAVGDNRTRADVVRRVEALRAPNLVPWTVRHITAIVGETVEIGAGTCLGPGAIVTSRVKIGEHCILNTNSSVSHDAEIGSYVNIGPGAAICGEVIVGDGCHIGPGATMTSGVQVGAWSVVGAGAVVTEDVPAHVTVVGSPARIVQRHGRTSRLPTVVG
jgi:acetyltransferase EpsM